MKWLGKLSFSLYLLHTFILVVVAQFFTKHFGMSFPAMIMTLSTTLILTLIASYFFHLKVDLPAITLANKFSSLLLGTKEKAAKAEGNQQQPAQHEKTVKTSVQLDLHRLFMDKRRLLSYRLNKPYPPPTASNTAHTHSWPTAQPASTAALPQSTPA